MGLDLLRNHDSLLVLDRGHFLLAEALLGALIVSEIQLGADKDDGYIGGVMLDLGIPLHLAQHCSAPKDSSVVYLGFHIVERGWADNGEAD